MGNILKFTFPPPESLKEFFEEKGVEYWKRIQDDFREKYGEDEEVATMAIVRELDLAPTAIHILNQMGFDNVPRIHTNGPLELKIIEYADQRVGPHGVVSIRERLEEGRRRYAGRVGHSYAESNDYFDVRVAALEAIEQELFFGSRARPTDIHDSSIAPIIEELWDYAIA